MGIGEVGTPDTTFIKKVLYVNGLQHNLLSIYQLCDEGHNVKFEHDRCYVSSSSFEPIFTAHRKRNVYVTDFQSLTKQNVNCLVAIEYDAWLWHRRLGHCNIHTLTKLSKKQLVHRLPKLKFQSNYICEPCQLDKQ